MQQIREYFEKSVHMTDHDWEIFSSKLVERTFPKKSLLLKFGQTEKHLSFIEKGIIRFYTPKGEQEITFSFSFAAEFVSAYDSFLRQLPCSYQVETLTETVLWQLTHNDLQQIYKQTEIGDKIGRLACEQLYLENIQREISLLTQTAEERYLNLLTEHPHFIQTIPLKYLASYIGITPQALSRIRKRIT